MPFGDKGQNKLGKNKRTPLGNYKDRDAPQEIWVNKVYGKIFRIGTMDRKEHKMSPQGYIFENVFLAAANGILLQIKHQNPYQ